MAWYYVRPGVFRLRVGCSNSSYFALDDDIWVHLPPRRGIESSSVRGRAVPGSLHGYDWAVLRLDHGLVSGTIWRNGRNVC